MYLTLANYIKFIFLKDRMWSQHTVTAEKRQHYLLTNFDVSSWTSSMRPHCKTVGDNSQWVRVTSYILKALMPPLVQSWEHGGYAGWGTALPRCMLVTPILSQELLSNLRVVKCTIWLLLHSRFHVHLIPLIFEKYINFHFPRIRGILGYNQ